MSPASLRRTMRICNSRGLHARASSRFVRTGAQFDVRLRVRCGELEVGGDSLVGLLTLGAQKGASITVFAVGSEAARALDALTALVADGFGEKDTGIATSTGDLK